MRDQIADLVDFLRENVTEQKEWRNQTKMETS